MRIRTFLVHSYLFWLVFSLLNFGYLWFLSVPLLPFLVVPWALNRFPFLFQLIAVALGSSVLLTVGASFAARRWKNQTVMPVVLTYLFNGIFVLVLLATAERERSIAMSAQLADRNPDCVHLNTFFTSVRNAGNPFVAHGLFKEDGKTFYWSYSSMSFFEGHERLDRNFPCVPKASGRILY